MGVGKFYTAEEALTLLRNTSDFEDESTSESEIEGDSSDSSEYAPEQQYQVRTNSNACFGDSYKPKKYTSYWCSKCKHALCIDPCFRLYHTEKDYTSEIIKIARHSVKPIQKDVQHVQNDVQHV